MSLVMFSRFYQELKGKREGIVLALDIINRRDVHPASVRWLIREKEDVEYQMEQVEQRFRKGEEE